MKGSIMVHIIASLASLLIALGAAAALYRTLSDGAEKIRLALGMAPAPSPRNETRAMRLRPVMRTVPAALPARRLRAA